MSSYPFGVCIKVSCLREKGYKDLREWMENKDNLYIGRHGRIFIDGKIFTYPGSLWENPYKVKEYGLNESLRLYKVHLEKLLEDKNNLVEFKKLKVYKELGCFCLPEAKCHRNIIIEKLKEVI